VTLEVAQGEESAQRSAIGSLGLPVPTPHDAAEQPEQNHWILLMVVFTVIVGLISVRCSALCA
jgi:hypothetical protein